MSGVTTGGQPRYNTNIITVLISYISINNMFCYPYTPSMGSSKPDRNAMS